MHVTKFVVAFVAFLIGGCTPLQQYRVETVKVGEYTKDQECEIHSGKDDPTKCANYAVEHRYYEYKDESGPTKDYYLAFVEFDDQGWFWDRKQMEVLLRLLYKKDEDFLIFVFAHGWRHNASVCDNNVVCFQRLLERFDVLERVSSKVFGGRRPKRPRKVVGIYVGWRGLSADVQPFELLSFWERKNTAQRVGLGGITELLARLNGFRRYKDPRREGNKTQLIIIGHSFGGKVIYSALSHSLIERAAQMWKDKKDKRLKYGTANSFGDLVVLVNPAFEGAIYEPLHHVATNRCYPERQRPVMLVITSEGDLATKRSFPAGSFFSNLFESARSSEQKETALHTVGHLERYRTHKIKLADGVDPKWSTKIDKSDCGCPYLAKTADFVEKLLDEEVRFLKNIRDEKYMDLTKDVITYGDEIVMTRNHDYASNYPYFVISTDDKIIPDHNEIYGEHFTNFLRRFYIRHITRRINFPKQCFKMPACTATDIEPCERSCRRLENEEASCSDRWVPQ